LSIIIVDLKEQDKRETRYKGRRREERRGEENEHLQTQGIQYDKEITH
jgi:hypothetical protein